MNLLFATKRFQAGDLDARSSNASKNEFGKLSESFNQLAENVQKNAILNEKVIEFARLMLSKYEVKEFFQQTVNALAEYTNSQMAAIYLLSSDEKTFKHFDSFGINDKAKQSFAADSFEGEFGAALLTHKNQRIKNIPDDTRFIFNAVSGELIPRDIITILLLARTKLLQLFQWPA